MFGDTWNEIYPPRLWWQNVTLDWFHVEILPGRDCPRWLISKIDFNLIASGNKILQLIIIIIMSHYQHRYPWPSLITPPYRLLLPAGPQGYFLYRRRAAVCRFKLVVLPLHVYVKGSTGVHHLWARPYFSSSVPHIIATKTTPLTLRWTRLGTYKLSKFAYVNKFAGF